MTGGTSKIIAHPSELELADFISGGLPDADRAAMEEHVAACTICLDNVVTAYEAVASTLVDKRKVDFVKKLNIYLVLAVISFALSFFMPRYFMQLLVATVILGIKWIADSRSTKMLVMIYEAWKRGGEKEASRILETLDSKQKGRF